MEFVLLAVVVALVALSRNAGEVPGRPPVISPPDERQPTKRRVHPEVKMRVEAWRRTVDDEAPSNLRPSLVLGVIAKESGGDAGIVNASDPSYGLMQITRPAWQDYQTETNDLETVIFPDSMLVGNLNIRVGSWFLERKLSEMPTTYDGLRAYNCGTQGATRNPNCGSDYARWVIDVGEPAFQEAVA